MKVVLDTNIYISALLSPAGSNAALLQAWKNKQFSLLTSKAQIDELRAVTKRTPQILSHQAGALINLLNKKAELVTSPTASELSPDPDDDLILAIALEGNLASLDINHVVALEKIGKTRIVHARDLLRQLS